MTAVDSAVYRYTVRDDSTDRRGAQHHEHYQHVAIVHDGGDDLARRLAPAIDRALDDGEAVLVCLEEDVTRALLGRVTHAAAVTVASPAEHYTRPGTAMRGLHEFVTQAIESEAPAVWAVGGIPLEGCDRDRRWLRYEAAVDNVLSHLPLRAVCCYDAAALPAAAVSAAWQLHSHIDDGGHVPDTTATSAAAPLTPDTTPTIRLDLSTTAQARAAVTTAFAGALGGSRLGDVHLAVSEIVANALLHGGQPISMSAWQAPEGVVIQVCDAGARPLDSYADLRPLRGGALGGFGMWIVGQLADEVRIDRSDGRTFVTAAFSAPARAVTG
jgi:anti-sigma regulatory factor (Ser/Thr protein kinase)